MRVPNGPKNVSNGPSTISAKKSVSNVGTLFGVTTCVGKGTGEAAVNVANAVSTARTGAKACMATRRVSGEGRRKMGAAWAQDTAGCPLRGFKDGPRAWLAPMAIRYAGCCRERAMQGIHRF